MNLAIPEVVPASSTPTIVRLGFLPLFDSAPLIIAKEKGFFTLAGLRVDLKKLTAWPHLRDALLENQLDAAHLLITIPIHLALREGKGEKLCYALTLNRQGNGIVLSNQLWNQGVSNQTELGQFYAKNPHHPMRLGIVFSQGTQEYFLRHWLAGASHALGAHPNLAIIPPQEMVGRLRKGMLDGFCVAEPWISRALDSKLGRLIIQSQMHLPGLADKVLAVRKSWHSTQIAGHAGLLQAIFRASEWLNSPDNHEEAVSILSAKRYINTTKSVISQCLKQSLYQNRPQEPFPPINTINTLSFAKLHRPIKPDIEWYLEQMLRWKHIATSQIVNFDFNSICLGSFFEQCLSQYQSFQKT